MTDLTPQLNDLVGSLSEPLRAAIRSAYEAGYRDGNLSAFESILKAAKGIVPAPLGDFMGTPQPSVRAKAARPKVHWNSAETRPFRYGAVAGAFREALRMSPAMGLSKEELVETASAILEADPSTLKYRDTFKRLRDGDEMLHRNGRYFPGPGLIGGVQNENVAPNGKPAGATEAGRSTHSELLFLNP